MHSVLDILIEHGLVTREQNNDLVEDGTITNSTIVGLVAAGFDDVAIAECLSEVLRIPRLDVAFIAEEVRDLLPRDFMAKWLCVPIQLQSKRRLVLGLVNPMDLEAIDAVRFNTNLDVVPRVLPLRMFVQLTGLDPEEGSAVARLANLILVDTIKRQRELTVLENGRSALVSPIGVELPQPVGNAVMRRLRTMAAVPRGPGKGRIVLGMGDRHYFFIVEFAVDERRALIHLVTRADFEAQLGDGFEFD